MFSLQRSKPNDVMELCGFTVQEICNKLAKTSAKSVFSLELHGRLDVIKQCKQVPERLNRRDARSHSRWYNHNFELNQRC